MDYLWIAIDPDRNFYGHPFLPAGYDSTAIGCDEVDGPGLNEPIWPVLFDTFEGLSPVIITDEMMEVFDGCADYIVAADLWRSVFPAEERTFMVAGIWSDYEVAAQNNVLVFPREVRTQKVPADWGDNAIPVKQDTMVFSSETRTHIVRKAG